VAAGEKIAISRSRTRFNFVAVQTGAPPPRIRCLVCDGDWIFLGECVKGRKIINPLWNQFNETITPALELQEKTIHTEASKTKNRRVIPRG
jgi:hypothetical protein